MRFSRTASANWQGSGKDGKGRVSTQSNVLNNAQYSYKTRFEDGIGTNPEELVGAAHAGCYSMKLSFVIGGMGFVPDYIYTDAIVAFEDGIISHIHLDVKASVDGMTNEQFQAAALDAKENCPISKSLNTEITMNAILL